LTVHYDSAVVCKITTAAIQLTLKGRSHYARTRADSRAAC